MKTFTFHGWLVVEVMTDDGLVGSATRRWRRCVTKQVIDHYLKPLLFGADPWDIEFLWQQMYRKTMAFGRKGIGMTAISAVDIALWDLLGKAAKQPVYPAARRPDENAHSRVREPALQQAVENWRAEAQKYKDEGYKAMKLRFGWGPTDGADGHAAQRGAGPHGARAVGDEIDVMADAYMGWTLDYAKRMLPLLEPFHLRWLEEPVIPDECAAMRN